MDYSLGMDIAYSAIVESSEAIVQLLEIRSRLHCFLFKFGIQFEEPRSSAGLASHRLRVSGDEFTPHSSGYADDIENLSNQIRSCVTHALAMFITEEGRTPHRMIRHWDTARRAQRRALFTAQLIDRKSLVGDVDLAVASVPEFYSFHEMIRLIDRIERELQEARELLLHIARSLSGQLTTNMY